MSEYSIVKTDFEKQKKELKDFAEQPATSTELDKFSTSGKFSDFLSGGLLGLMDHKVTGEEMNKLVTKLQTCFAEINERDRKVIKEFGQVYETFEALDKGYIQGILIGVKSAEEASKEAKAAQKDIDDTIKALKLTVQKLQEFKNQVNAHTHLKDIDAMWGDLRSLKKNTDKISSELEKQYKNLDKKISDLEKHKADLLKISHIKDIDEMWGDLQETVGNIESLKSEIATVDTEIKVVTESVNKYRSKLDQITHLDDIDELWNQVQNLNSLLTVQIEKMESTIDDIQDRIKTLTLFSKSQVHFGDVDSMWESLDAISEKTKTNEDSIKTVSDMQQGQKNTIETLQETVADLEKQEHIKDIDVEWEYTHSLGEKIETEGERISDSENRLQKLEEQIENAKNENSILRNKISVAYIVAVGAIGLSVIQLILSVLGIL